MATITTLLVRLGADPAGVEKGMAKAEKIVDRASERMAQAAAVAGAAIGAALAAGIVDSLNIDAANDKLAASLGAFPSEADRLGRIAGDLYAGAFGDSMEQASGAVGAVISSIEGIADATDDVVQRTTEKVLNLASAFEVDFARVAQLAGQVVKSGLAADADQALDLLTGSLQRVPTAVRDDLLDALDEYGPFLQALGVKGEQAFGLLVQAAGKGQYGIDKTGDALKEFTIRATDMSAASKVGFDILGMSQKKMAGQLLAGGDTAKVAFDQIIAGLQSIQDPVKQSQAALALFGTPLEDLSVAEIPKFLEGLGGAADVLGDVTGEADRMGQTLNDNNKVALESFKRQLQMGIVEWLGKAAAWIQRNSELVKMLAMVLGPLVGVITAIVVISKIWTIVQTALNVVMMANPIGLIILAIVALIAIIVLIATKTTWFKDLWDVVWGWITRTASAAWEWIKAKALAFWDWIKSLPGLIKGAFASLGEIIFSPWKWAFNKIASFWNNGPGKLSFHAPDWIPGIGGKGFSLPKIPMLESGGQIREGGAAVVADRNGRGGEVVSLPRGARVDPLPAGGRQVIVLDIRGGEDDMKRMVRKWVRVDGRGSVKVALAGSRD